MSESFFEDAMSGAPSDDDEEEKDDDLSDISDILLLPAPALQATI